MALLGEPHWEIPARLIQPQLKELLSLRRPPTAILAGDDHRAIHILHACRQLGVDVPGRLSVMGYPNNPEASLTQPALSVVDACFEEVGKAAVRLLVETVLAKAHPSQPAQPAQPGQTENIRKPATSIVIPPRLVLRQTTGPAAGNQTVPTKQPAPPVA